VHVARTIPEERYVDALLREIAAARADDAWNGRSVASVFFGGGTPSLFAPESFERVMRALDDAFGVHGNAEVSLEANPEDVAPAEPGTLRALRAAGVNRLSLGAQSFDSAVLATLGRMHASGDIVRAIVGARAAGFDNVSCDLIFAVPGETVDTWRADLERAIALAPEHVSTYGLTYEEGTPLTAMRARGSVRAVGEDDERRMYETAIDVLTAAGYRHYEISNFARPGCESRHNLAYWSWSDYLGIGAGAHGFTHAAALEHARDGQTQELGENAPDVARSDRETWGMRYANVKPPGEYMERSPHVRASAETLDRTIAMAEFLMVGLRRIDGFEERAFESTFGVTVDSASPVLASLVDRALLSRVNGRIALTREGLMLADSVTAKLAAAIAA
jgi:oxygen-independent coproporphyrinogen-3 oxidase